MDRPVSDFLHGAIDCDIHPAVPNTRVLLPYLDDYWPFYADMHGRQDLLPDTHYYTPDEIDRVTAPARSLLVAPANGVPSEGVLISHGWSAVKTVTEPTGQPTFVIYEKQ